MLYRSRCVLCSDPFVRRPSEAVGDGFDGLGGPSYGISKRAIPSRERYSATANKTKIERRLLAALLFHPYA